MSNKVEIDILEMQLLQLEAQQRGIDISKRWQELLILLKSGASDAEVESKRNDLVMAFEANVDETISALKRANKLGR